MSELSPPEFTNASPKTAGMIHPAVRNLQSKSSSGQSGKTSADWLVQADGQQEPTRPEHYLFDRPMNRFDGILRKIVRKRIAAIISPQFEWIEQSGSAASASVCVHVHDRNFYRRVLLGGSVGAAESYLAQEWSTNNLVELIRMFSRNLTNADPLDGNGPWLSSPLSSLFRWSRRNTKSGSRRNIAAHYDLSNAFFELMLDPTMTYSAGIFPTKSAGMQTASLTKYDRICQKLALSEDDHLLEMGTGWGGFAVYAARNYGCRITTTTISRQQFDYATKRVAQAGLSDRVTILLQDYRDLRGRYDKLVSIEMIEAVGEQYLDRYFRRCSQLLHPAGLMVLQAITMPDYRYDAYRKSLDFIQKYIFPGGFLPAYSAITRSLRTQTDLTMNHAEDFGLHYAETLQHWRDKFWQNIDAIRKLGFDERFVRMWHYYLCYCEAAFLERQIGVSQMVLTKPACQISTIASLLKSS